MRTMQLYESLMSAKEEREDILFLQEKLNKCELFFIDNVANYLSEIEEIDIYRDCPNIAPPFPLMYFEYKNPLKKPEIFGTMMDAKRSEDGWTYITVNFAGNAHGFGTLFGNMFVSDNDGKPYGFGDPDLFKIIGPKSIGDNIDFYSDSSLWYLSPVLMAISFMHCKNVTAVPRGAGTYGRRGRKNKPRVRYHVLEIEPMKRVLRTEGKADEVGLKRALHICRGHFKDYRDGAGLFGRYQDIYWWESHVRGDASEGVVLKDYKVNAP